MVGQGVTTEPPAAVDAEQLLRELMVRAMPGLRAFVRRLCGHEHDAEDVLQEALAKVWRLRAGFDPQQNGEAWLQRAAFRSFCDLRQRHRRAPRVDDALAEARHDAATPAPGLPAELRDELGHRLAGLDELQRALLLGFHGDGLSLRDLAQRHRLPLNTVKSHLHRARRALQRRREEP